MKNAITGNLVKFTFEDGVPPLTFDCTKASGATRAMALVYGFSVRLTRMAALSRADKDGNVKTITEQMRRDAIAEGIAHYESGAEAWELRTTRTAARNPIWEQIAIKRNVAYDVVAAEMAQRDLDALAAL